MTQLPPAITGFLAAVNSGDGAGLHQYFTDDVTYHLIVPVVVVSGRDDVVAALSASVGEADRVQWDVVAWAQSDDTVFVERVDRFWFGGHEAAIECTSVFELRDGKIAVVRDYADLGTWRARKQAAVDGPR